MRQREARPRSLKMTVVSSTVAWRRVRVGLCSVRPLGWSIGNEGTVRCRVEKRGEPCSRGVSVGERACVGRWSFGWPFYRFTPRFSVTNDATMNSDSYPITIHSSLFDPPSPYSFPAPLSAGCLPCAGSHASRAQHAEPLCRPLSRVECTPTVA